MLVWGPVRNVTVFASLYLVLSLPPFLLLYRNSIEIDFSIVSVAIFGTGALVILSSLFLASEGVDRFTRFLTTPTDAFSIIVSFAFVLAAVSWWLLPQLTQFFGWGVDLVTVLSIILVSHVPLTVFLSLMTVVGEAKKSSSE